MNDLILSLYLVNESLMRLRAVAEANNRPDLVTYARQQACQLLLLIGKLVKERADALTAAGQLQPPVKA